MRRVLALLAAAVAACGGLPGSEPEPTTTTVPPSGASSESVLRCAEVSLPSADPSLYRDTPKYVGNEMPAEEVRRWASQYSDFVDIWIDREHNGWVAAGFTDNVAERQAGIEAEFGDEGVVAVHLDWTESELADLQGRVVDELDGVVDVLGSSIDALRGYVWLQLPVLSDGALTEIQDRFPGERICVDGLEPEDVVPPGPQPQEGEGWRLIFERDEAGDIYRTGLAWDQESFSALIDTIPDLGSDLDLDVDFETEVVIWFGAVHGSSCPNLRLDDVIVDGEVVHAVIVDTDNALACTGDAIPHTYLVAVERERLPAPPFYIALGPDSPGDRILVEADLRQAGSTADPSRVGPDPDPPGREPEGSGVIIETGFPWEYTVDLSCGFEAIGEINSFHWVTSEPIPDSWIEAAAGTESVVVEVLLKEGPEPSLEVTFRGETVVYRPTDEVGCP